jgi:penicillin amidase
MPADPTVEFAPLAGVDLSGIETSMLEEISALTAPIRFSSGGSNNWAVDGVLSDSGKPLLASDPHLWLWAPSVFHIVHLTAPGWNVIGAGEPGLPGVGLGHNERIAWALTVSRADQADLFVEETDPDNANRYRAGSGWADMEIIRETIEVKGQQPVEVELRYTRHGPVIHEDRGRNRAYALHWVGNEPGTMGLLSLSALALNRAGNSEEFLQALHRWKAPALNFVYADVDGNIGWVAAGLTPVRQGWHGLLPAPGKSDDYYWRRFLKGEELPQLQNPTEHFIATANHNILKMLPSEYPHEISYDWWDPYRYLRIRERLTEKREFTVEDFQNLQLDQISIPGRQLAGLLRQVGVPDRDLRAFFTLMTEWDGSMSASSQAAPLYLRWLAELKRGFFGAKAPERLLAAVGERYGYVLLLRELNSPTESWFGAQPERARDELVRSTFRTAVEETRERLGEDPAHWRWGDLHHVAFQHPLSSYSKSAATAFNVGSFPTPGGPFTLNLSLFTEDHRRFVGPFYRQIFDLADWDKGVASTAPGQSGQRGSPHYDDLVGGWMDGEYFPLAFSRGKVEEVTEHKLVLTPDN